MISTTEVVLISGSLTVCGCTAWRLVRRRTLPLPHEPRRPVPWSAFSGLFLATLLLVLSVSSFLAEPPLVEQTVDSPMTAEEYVEQSGYNAMACLLMVAVISGSIAASTGANAKDFGLPTDRATAAKDARLGAAATLLCLGPVLLMQALMIPLFDSGSQNQTLMMLEHSSGIGVRLAAILNAVIVAPLFEEFVFRLLLQGWLEKAEQQVLAEPQGEAEAGEGSPSPRELATAVGLLPGLAPILISSLVFSLVHLSAGPDPIALNLFALVQGYLYLRTHRILPCVVNHMLFNAFSLTLTLL